MSKTIGYPRALHFYEFFPFFKKFFQELGLDVVTSEPTTDRTVARGDELALSQTCLAQKIAYAHTESLLKDTEVDKVFVPTFISGGSVSGSQDSQMCVYVQANSGLQRARFGSELTDKIVAPVLEFGRGREGKLNHQLHTMASGLNPDVSKNQVNRIITDSFQSLKDFRGELQNIGTEAIQKAQAKEDPLFVMLARYYIARDPRLNSGIDKIVQEKGYDCISMDMLPLRSAAQTPEFEEAHSNLFWSYHQQLLAAAHIVRNNDFMKAIATTCFSCGPDSFVMNDVEKVLDGKILRTKVDSADMTANIRTRAEAFINTTINAKGRDTAPAPKLEDPLVLYHPSKNNPEKRIVVANLMCDHGQAVAAELRGRGFPVFASAANTDRTLLKGKTHMGDSVCVPCAETGGPIIDAVEKGRTRLNRADIVLDSRLSEELGPYTRVQTPQGEALEINYDPRNFAFFQGTADGPCRYGRYAHLQAEKAREIYQKQVITRGLEKGTPLQDILSSREYKENPIRFFVLSSVDSYALDGLGYLEGIQSQAAFWKHIRAVDTLQKARGIQRVKEKTPGDVDEIYEETLRNMCRKIEGKEDYTDVLYTAASKLDSIPTRDVPPVFGQVVGEIYVRQNEHINKGVARSLEQESVGSIVSPFGLWIKYVTGLHINDLMTEQGRTSKLHPLKKLKLQRDIYTAKTRLWYQERSERNIETPFLPITGIFPDPTLSEVMSEGAKYLDPAFGGEAIISAAELSLAMHHGYSSALNLMPFTCMPSNVVIGLEQSIRGANKHFPIAHLEYDGSEDPTYRDRLAVHAHQSHRHFDRNADQILTTQEHHRKQALAAYHKKADPSRKIK